MRFQHMDLGAEKSIFGLLNSPLDFFPSKNSECFVVKCFFWGLLDEVVNPAHGPLQALLGVDGGGSSVFAREKNGAKRLGNFPTLHKPLKSPKVLWVISGHILLYYP